MPILAEMEPVAGRYSFSSMSRKPAKNMLITVTRNSIEEDVTEELQELVVMGHANMDHVAGIDTSGHAHAPLPGNQDNTTVLAALPDDKAESVITGLQRFSELIGERRHAPVPLHLFVWPCEQES